jgi:hypothetical protein
MQIYPRLGFSKSPFPEGFQRRQTQPPNSQQKADTVHFTAKDSRKVSLESMIATCRKLGMDKERIEGIMSEVRNSEEVKSVESRRRANVVLEAQKKALEMAAREIAESHGGTIIKTTFVHPIRGHNADFLEEIAKEKGIIPGEMVPETKDASVLARKLERYDGSGARYTVNEVQHYFKKLLE